MTWSPCRNWRARDWRMTMLTPEYQLQAPFFLGGEDVWVAYPTDSMPQDKKLMALRGNNRHFSRAVVHHELIPGHHLQHFYNARYQPQRQLFDTPFWSEGWALYWELRLYERGFARTPEERIGMLFWRNHRAARILFSLGFHLGKMTPQPGHRHAGRARRPRARQCRSGSASQFCRRLRRRCTRPPTCWAACSYGPCNMSWSGPAR